MATEQRWLVGEAKAGMAEANDPATEWVDHEAVEQEMQQERESLQARIMNKI